MPVGHPVGVVLVELVVAVVEEEAAVVEAAAVVVEEVTAAAGMEVTEECRHVVLDGPISKWMMVCCNRFGYISCLWLSLVGHLCLQLLFNKLVYIHTYIWLNLVHIRSVCHVEG